MRYEGCLLTAAESMALIDDVDRWCRRTGTNYNRLVVIAGVGVTIRHKVRVKGQRVTFQVAERLHQAMKDHGSGISREVYRTVVKPWDCPIPPIEPHQIMRAIRETCGRCGSRVGFCEHTLSAIDVGIRAAV